MTETPTTDPNELLSQLINAMQQRDKQIEALTNEVLALKKTVAEEIPKQINAEINNLASQTADGIKKLGDYINEVKAAPSAATPQQSGGIGGMVEKVVNVIEKAFNGGQASGNPIGNTLEQMATDNFKTQLKIMQYQSQAMLKQAAQAAGVPAAALEDISHIVVDA